MKLFKLIFITLFLTSCASNTLSTHLKNKEMGRNLYVKEIIFSQDRKIQDTIKDKSNLPEALNTFIKKYTENQYNSVVSNNSEADVLAIKIIDAFYDPSGKGSKSVYIEGVLKRNGSIIANFVGRRISGRRGTYGILDLCAEILAKDVGRWLEDPTKDAIIGDLTQKDDVVFNTQAFSNTEDSSATTKKNNLKINLAISEFKNLKKISKYNWLKLGIPELMASFLSNTKGIKLLERGNLNKVLEEQSRVQSGIIDATNSAEFGKIAGASHMMTGSYHINNNKITINARMIKTETGQQLRAENITGNINDINEIVKKVVLKLSGSIGNILTAEEKQKIAEQGKGMMKKIEAVSKGQLSLKSGDIDAARKYYTDALRNDPNNETLKKLLKDIDVSLKALAIVEFKNNNNDSKYNVFSKSIPADLTSLMIQKTGLPFVERLRIDATIAEMALPQDGLIDPKTAPEFGKIVGASQLISGSFNINNNKITIHTRLIDTQTGVNSFSYSETGAIDDIKKIETKIVDQFIQSLMNVIVTKNPIKIATKTRGIAKSIDDALSEGKKEASFNLEESVVQFDFGKDTIKPSSYTVLKEIAQVLKEHPEYRIYILGHTDNVGTAENNKTLSERRAKNVMKKFIQYGAIAVKLNAIGEGEDNPIADNSTENGRSKNRRVGLLFKK